MTEDVAEQTKEEQIVFLHGLLRECQMARINEGGALRGMQEERNRLFEAVKQYQAQYEKLEQTLYLYKERMRTAERRRDVLIDEIGLLRRKKPVKKSRRKA